MRDAAVRWFARLQDEAATPEDWAAFEAWLSASPAHPDAYERLERVWVEVEQPEAQAALAPATVVPFRRKSQVTRRVWLFGGGAIAASVAAAVVGVGLLSDPATTTYVTRAGETREVPLADGSRMRLNAETRLTVRLGRRERRVELADGEAVFDVAHDADRPFVVGVGDRDVRVIGTEFNLRRRAGEVALNVRRGVVEVRPATPGSAASVRVPAGRQFVHREGAAGGALSTTAPDAAFAWTQGQLVYRDAPMSQVAADLTRSLGVPVRVGDAATGALRFTGVLTVEDPAIVMRRLQAFAPVHAVREGDAFVLRRAGR
ncbi:MAG: FecR domain-containing protein [Phenylobacterium sp.]|uniref:FecR family protein n=1 Tax=Phenylobacterium sp. TaxID=1871053 RepID=UPI001A38D016|nr:FecR domain-containing protein [Phenylobacterium sp.]MBL8554249.1 FecR domain-containing protein [Phenylobacterium sp.]